MMEDLLHYKDLFDFVKLGSVKPVRISEDDWGKLDRKATWNIWQWVEFIVYPYIRQEVDTHVLWKKLEDMFERKNAQSKAFVIRKQVNLKFKNGQSIVDHLSDFQDLVN